MPTTHTITVSQDRLLFLYARVKGFTIYVGKVIEHKIRECAARKQKSAALLFPSLIIRICEASGIKFNENNESAKIEGPSQQEQ